MATVVDTKMRSRARTRVGRRGYYNPTSAEETSYGAGPYAASIIEINTDGTVDLLISLPVEDNTPGVIGSAAPTAISGADPTAVAAADPGAALGAFTDPPSAAEMATLRTRVNEIRTLILDLKARQAENRTLLIDLSDRQGEDLTILTEVKAEFVAQGGGAIKSNVVVGTGTGQFRFEAL